MTKADSGTVVSFNKKGEVATFNTLEAAVYQFKHTANCNSKTDDTDAPKCFPSSTMTSYY